MTTTTVGQTKPPITATGMKGFLLWFAREQPGIFSKIAPQLPGAVPKAFSNYNATYRRLGALIQEQNARRGWKKMAGLGDTSNAAYFSSAQTSSFAPDVSLPVVMPAVDTTDFASQIGTPVAAAANTGVSSTPTAAAIGQVIGAASAIYMTSQQASLQNSVVQTNLQRAAAGLPPLNTSLNQLGVPTVSVGGAGIFSSSSGMLLLVGLGIAALALAGGKKS